MNSMKRTMYCQLRHDAPWTHCSATLLDRRTLGVGDPSRDVASPTDTVHDRGSPLEQHTAPATLSQPLTHLLGTKSCLVRRLAPRVVT
jgi:hypothetical protein